VKIFCSSRQAIRPGRENYLWADYGTIP